MFRQVARLGLLLTALLMIFICAGCGDQKLDMSNDKAYSESMTKIYQAIPEGEREEFRKNFNAILSEIPKLGLSALHENDLMRLYDYAKLFGGDEGTKMLKAVNGLTAKDITKRGREIRKVNLAEKLTSLKAELSALEKEVEKDKQFTLEPGKVEVICTGVELKEGFNFENKPWGTIHTITALIDIKNNSSEPVQQINGKIVFSDDVDGQINELFLSGLKEAGTGKTLSPSMFSNDDSWEVAPGSVGKGELILQFHGPNKKHPFPASKKYSATLSDIKVRLKGESDRNEFSMKVREGSLEQLKISITEIEKELAALKR